MSGCQRFFLVGIGVWLLATGVLPAGEEKKGATLFVSKLGDGSDGSSWNRAFRTIQDALNVVPDDRGGHRVLIRPDTYPEANLFPARKGAFRSPNILQGDCDGRLGSGASGWVIVDSGDPEKGFKSYDWWTTMRAYRRGWSPQHADETFSGVGWDRWVIRNIYASGSDAGLFWDMVDEAEPFTVTVEDCVGIGRAFGGGAAQFLGRPDEPIVFRRCYLACLDWWGDAGAAYVRAAHSQMPDRPDAVFEKCTLVAPDNAFELAASGFPYYTRVRFSGCRLIVLNFSQPSGTPSTGIIHAPRDAGGHLHVELEDTSLVGYKVFGESLISYTIKGRVEAYVQFQQPMPEGFIRLSRWPEEVFRSIGPPSTPEEMGRRR